MVGLVRRGGWAGPFSLGRCKVWRPAAVRAVAAKMLCMACPLALGGLLPQPGAHVAHTPAGDAAGEFDGLGKSARADPSPQCCGTEGEDGRLRAISALWNQLALADQRIVGEEVEGCGLV